MNKDIEYFIQKNNERQNKINVLADALKATQFLEKDAVQNLDNGSTKEISSVFDGSKIVYRASTNGKNVMHFTSPDQIKDYIEQ